MDRRDFLASTGKTILGGIALSQYSAPLFAEEQASSDATAAMPRRHVPFDDGWKFFLGDVADGENVHVEDQSWRYLNLPHDWSIEGPFSEDNPSGPEEAYLPCGIGWYRKEFILPASAKGKHLEIQFDGIYMNSDVWINGRHLGKRPNGYVSFTYDLTPYLRFDGHKNVIAVRVDNSKQPNSRWYTGSGIYRHVWLTVTGPVRIDTWGTFVRTPQVARESCRTNVSIRVRNSSLHDRTVRTETEILSPDGLPCGRSENLHVVPARGNHTFEQHMTIVHPQRWSIECPVLYTAITRLYIQKELVDEYHTAFGVRSFMFDADKGFSLNEDPIKLKGVCIHHDLGSLGSAFNETVMERRLRLLKDMGCNAIRMSHNPPAPQLLDMCDRIGFLVMNEAFDEWRVRKITYGYHLYFDQWAKTDLMSMIERDRNHPSIILWSIGNEIKEASTLKGVETAKMLAAIVREMDTSRPVTCAIQSIENANKSGFAEVFDVVGYNGGGGSDYDYDVDHQNYPGRKIYGSEAPHTAQTRGVYASDQYYCSSYDSCFIRMNCEGQWKMVQDRPFVAGAFRWTGFDYLGEPTRNSAYHMPLRKTIWPARSGNDGVLDTCGFQKDIYYFYQSQWGTAPMVHLLPHWNWQGMEGKPIFVWCYTNCDSVELFLNDRSLGIQHPVSTAGYHLAWEVPYVPGKLRAVGKCGGKQECIDEVCTSGPPKRLELTCERKSLLADGCDLAYISIRIVDSVGTLVPDANNLVFFDVQGAGTIVGVDNGDPLSHQNFKGSQMKSFHGKCLLIVRATSHAGQITIRATSTGLEETSLHLEVVNT